MIEIKNVSKTYKNGVEALRSINLTIADGEFCFIVGPSGSGKSTLVRLLTKELEPTEGEIMVNELALQRMKRRHVPKYRRRLGVVFQDFRLLEDRTVYENISFAELIAGKSNAEIRKDVSEMLERVGLSDKRDAYPRELSGGEQQRTAIARALINQPEILIADEPTGNLDHEHAVSIMKLLASIHAQGTTVIVITHDLGLVQTMQKRTVHMADGQIISDTAEIQFERALAPDAKSEAVSPAKSMPSPNAEKTTDGDATLASLSVTSTSAPIVSTSAEELLQKSSSALVPRRGRSRRKPDAENTTDRRTGLRLHHLSRKKRGTAS